MVFSNFAPKEKTEQPKVLVFSHEHRHKQRTLVQECIFCGKKVTGQTFRGKAVCYTCLSDIPSLFICG